MEKIYDVSLLINEDIIIYPGNEGVLIDQYARVDFEKGVEHLIYYNNNFPGLLNKLIINKFKPEEFKKAIEEFKGIKAVIEF